MSRWTWHGGGIAAARAQFGGGDWLDLSTGINPTPWPGVADVAIDWQALPDEAGLAALEAAAAACFGTMPEQVCALPGTEIGLRLAGLLLPGPAAYLTPSYRTHAAMFADASAVESIDRPGTLILANPNNPDGRVIAPDAILARADWTLVDEAFADADPAHSVARWVGDARKLIVFRSFGKFFGLAGVRLGFVLGPRAVIARFRERLGAWPVSAAAIAIGTAAYRDGAWIEAERGRLVARRDALDAVLARHGHVAMGGSPLFRLIETPDAGGLFQRLAGRAILTRPFDYAPHWLRIGLPADDAALDRLDRALGDG